MLHLVRLGDQRCDRFQGRKDADLFALGMQREDLVEEPEAFHRQRETGRTTCRGESLAVDRGHVCSQSVVDHQYDVNRRNHDLSSTRALAVERGQLARPMAPMPAVSCRNHQRGRRQGRDVQCSTPGETSRPLCAARSGLVRRVRFGWIVGRGRGRRSAGRTRQPAQASRRRLPRPRPHRRRRRARPVRRRRRVRHHRQAHPRRTRPRRTHPRRTHPNEPAANESADEQRRRCPAGRDHRCTRDHHDDRAERERRAGVVEFERVEQQLDLDPDRVA